MDIKRYSQKDLKEYISLCRAQYGKHIVFSKPDAEIIEYLKKKDEADAFNGLFIAIDKKVLGGLLLETKGNDGSHFRFQINHLAGKAKEELLKHALQSIRGMIGRSIRSAKIEVMLAETEKDKDLYIRNGFAQEGSLKSHYRQGERVDVLGLEMV